MVPLLGTISFGEFMDQFQVSAGYKLDFVRGHIETNVARNLPPPNYGAVKGGSCAVCANGPSLKTVYPLNRLQPVAALNGAWRSLVANGIMPTYVICYDPTPENATWFKDAPCSPVYLIGSRACPEVFEALRGKNVRIWHMADKPELDAGISRNTVVYGGCTVGLHALNLLAALGFNHFDLYGYDSCYTLEGEHHATDQPWGLGEPLPFQVGDTMYIAEPWMAAQVQEFFKIVEANRHDYTVEVHSPGMLQAVLKERWGATSNDRVLEAVYNLDYAPGSFDFIWSLMNIENCRRYKGYKGAVVHFKAGRDRGFRPNEIIDVNHDHKSGMLNNVVRPMLNMFGLREVDEVGPDAVDLGYKCKHVVDVWQCEQELPSFKASAEATEWARQHKGAVTITLREAHYWPQRNSRVEEWVKFAHWLKANGETPIIIRDTYSAFKSTEGLDICPEASIHLDKRLALYRAAKMNLFVVNGPAGLAWASRDIPYITMWTEAPGYHCYDTNWLKSSLGFGHGEQFPWHNEARQRIVWEEDIFENICTAYKAMTQGE
jgi:hypothetical protein